MAPIHSYIASSPRPVLIKGAAQHTADFSAIGAYRTAAFEAHRTADFEAIARKIPPLSRRNIPTISMRLGANIPPILRRN